MSFLITILIVLAALSPLLTFARLWQIKEWRVDRLREHLWEEGWWSQLCGWLRPIVIGSGILLLTGLRITAGVSGILDREETSGLVRFLFSPLFALILTTSVLGWFTLFRFVINRQAMPVWTKKSFLVSGLAFFYLLVLSLLLAGFRQSIVAVIILMCLPLVSSVFVLLGLLTVYPFDRMLKMALLQRARVLRGKLGNISVVGITGSVGKTTTKELLAHILADRAVISTPVHVNSELGVAAFMLENLTEEHQVFIVEMGAYRRGEIANLCSVVKPHLGIITYIGKQHLALFGSRADLCKAKGELFASLPPAGHAFLNADSDYCADLSAMAACPVHTVGTGGHATFEAFDIVERPEGISFTMRTIPFLVPLRGTHQVTNILLAIACAESLGVPIEESAKRLRSFAVIPRTFERKEGKSGQVVLDDTHNASPESFRAAIDWARGTSAKSRVLITSGLLELGPEVRNVYLELGTLAADVFDEVIFLNNKFVRYFEQGYGRRVVVVSPRKLRSKLKEGTLVVCEGRMGEEIVERLLK